MAFSFDLGLAISAERYGAISAGPEQNHFSSFIYKRPAPLKVAGLSE